MIKQFIFFIALFCLPVLGLATEVVHTVNVQGYGMTQDEAVRNGLIEALKQTKGVSINSNKSFSKKLRQKNVLENEKNSRKISVASLSQSSVKEATKGIISSYRVVRAKHLGTREWRVDLRVKMLSYKAPGLGTKNRRKIAILPFTYAKRYFDVKGERYSGSEISNMLNQSLTDDFTQSRRFAVIDRKYLSQTSQELKIIASAQTPLSQKVKLGQKLGADYILVGAIQAVDAQTINSRDQLLGESSSQTTLNMVVDYRIIVVATSQIKWSATKKITLDMNQNSSKMEFRNVVDGIAHTITNELLSNIYPIRVVKVTKKGAIVLNQGGNSVKLGSKMKIMRPGKKMFDPYTKEYLGQEETQIALIEITSVMPKVSYAKVVSGSLKKIRRRDICRRVQSETSTKPQVVEDNPNWRKSSVEVQEGGGVRLPFD